MIELLETPEILLILISTVVGFTSGFLLSQFRDYLKTRDDVEKCKTHINFDLNKISKSWIDEFKLYTVYLRKFENKTLWDVFQERKINPVSAMNVTVSTSQFELFEAVKHSGILSLIISEDLHHITTIQTHLRSVYEQLKKITLEGFIGITKEVFYQEVGKKYLKDKIQVYESALSSIIKNCEYISWVKFNEENQEFMDSFKINSETKSEPIYEDLVKEY